MDDAGQQRDFVAAEPVRVALAVRTLVVELDDRQVRREEMDAAQDARADARMLFDEREFLRGQRSGLRSTASLMPIFPMSCSSAPEPQNLELVVGQVHLPPDDHRYRADALGWPAVYGSRASSASASARIAPT